MLVMDGPLVKYEAHPRGNKGTRKSVRKTVQSAAAGRLSPKVAAWAQTAIKDAGTPQDKHSQAVAILAAMRRDKFYIPDPVDAERIVLPDCLLADCDGLKMDAGDCDDLSAALAAALESVGIVCAIVGQAFNKQQQYQHILVACEIEDGLWMYADPSDRDMPLGQSHSPSREFWMLVPSGKVLCDHAPSCEIPMRGVHPNANDRPSGDGIFVGDGMSGMPPGKDIEQTADLPSVGWTIIKSISTLAIIGLAGYGGYKIAKGE